MEGGIGKDIALLCVGTVTSLGPWLSEKAGIEMPRTGIVFCGWIAIAAFSWGSAKLIYVIEPEYFQGIKMSVSGIVILILAIFLATWWGLRTDSASRHPQYARQLSQASVTSSASVETPILVAPKNQAVPIIGITLRQVVVEPYDDSPGRSYPRKLRLYCSNDGADIRLGIGRWIQDQIGIQIGKPPTCQYQLRDHLRRWDKESSDRFIASGKWFRLYVGLDSSIAEDKLTQMKSNHRLGLLEIPAEVSGVHVSIRICP